MELSAYLKCSHRLRSMDQIDGTVVTRKGVQFEGELENGDKVQIFEKCEIQICKFKGIYKLIVSSSEISAKLKFNLEFLNPVLCEKSISWTTSQNFSFCNQKLVCFTFKFWENIFNFNIYDPDQNLSNSDFLYFIKLCKFENGK